MKLQIFLVGVVMLSITSFTSPETNITVTKKSPPEQSVHKPTTVLAHLYTITDNNSHIISKILFFLDGTTIQDIWLFDNATCDAYTNESWTGTVTYSGGVYSAQNLHITYDYPVSGSGSVTLNCDLFSGGIICE
jgi:hypothetical protein